VKDPHAQWRRYRTNGAVQAPANRFDIEPDANDVGDALRGWDLADNQVRATPRHQPVNLAGD
jgi:hypothetical protein